MLFESVNCRVRWSEKWLLPRYDVPRMGTVLASERSQPGRVDTTLPVEVSVVIPCLNEANSLAFCVDKALNAFRASGLSGEVIVADNGSTDGSIQIAEEHGARVVHVAERGYGSALQAGIAAARGPFIIMGDADDSYDFTEVPRFVEKLREGYDIVMGNRFRGGIKPGAMPPSHKYVGNPGLTALLNTLFRARIGDSYCGMRGFTRALYDRLDVRSTGMEFALEMIIKAAQIGARLAEPAVHADVRAELAVFSAGCDLIGGWSISRFLVAARAAPDCAAHHSGHSHHDFRRDFYAHGNADSFDWSFRQSFLLRGTF